MEALLCGMGRSVSDRVSHFFSPVSSLSPVFFSPLIGLSKILTWVAKNSPCSFLTSILREIILSVISVGLSKHSVYQKTGLKTGSYSSSHFSKNSRSSHSSSSVFGSLSGCLLFYSTSLSLVLLSIGSSMQILKSSWWLSVVWALWDSSSSGSSSEHG